MEKKLLNKEEKNYSKIINGTLLYGVIINFVILSWLDSKIDCDRSFDGAVCSPYNLYLFFSLFLGWIISVILLKFEKRK